VVVSCKELLFLRAAYIHVQARPIHMHSYGVVALTSQTTLHITWWRWFGRHHVSRGI